PTHISTLSLHAALPISPRGRGRSCAHRGAPLRERQRENEVSACGIVLGPEPTAVRLREAAGDREAEPGAVTGRAAPERLEQRLRSEEHTSELQSRRDLV